MARAPKRQATPGTRHGNGGKGQGWGGPAKGVSTAKSFLETGQRITNGHSDDVQARVAEREARRRAQAEAVMDEIHRIAVSGAREGDRITAGVAFLNRVEGTPVQRTITTEVDDARLVINVMTDFHDRD